VGCCATLDCGKPKSTRSQGWGRSMSDNAATDPTGDSMWRELIDLSTDALIAMANQRAIELDLTPSPTITAA
jgi:hypothetical protein